MKSDLQLFADVSREVKNTSDVPCFPIGVKAHDGIVTLAGLVGTYADKWAAMRRAEHVSGVRAIVDEIRVGLHSDEDIARRVLKLLPTLVPHPDLQVRVKQGWILIKGNVQFKQQKNAIQDAIRSVAGVRGITDRVNVLKGFCFRASGKVET